MDMWVSKDKLFGDHWTRSTFKVFVSGLWSGLYFLVWHIVLMAMSLGLTAPPQGLGVRQSPPSLTVMRGETASLSCHFQVQSLKYGVQWFRMKRGKQLIQQSSRHVLVEKNQSSSLLITHVAPKDSGRYFCEVNVLHKDPELGNGTLLSVLGESTQV